MESQCHKMKTGILLCFVAVILLQQSTAQLTTASRKCQTTSECNKDECCYILPKYPIPSRRNILIPPEIKEEGTCQQYHMENETCEMFDFKSCGCTPGLRCVFDKTGMKRSFMWSGRFMCKPRRTHNPQ